jgi:hypothetical protein
MEWVRALVRGGGGAGVGVRWRWCRRSRGSLGGEARQSTGRRATVKDSFRVGGHEVGKKGTSGVQVGRGCGWWSS